MACGTPVMVNNIGGVEEYVSPDVSFIMQDKNVDEWVDLLTDLSRNREQVWSREAAAR